jgi:putative spermidine/putrescine transport system ATP-binding protein/spermidine/putrescine transport system ATP-binding protein
VDEGSFVTLLGPSGCGKTTVLRMIAGLTPPTAGDILVKGRRVNDVPIHQRNLGLVFQNLALFPHRTVVENVAYGLKFRRMTASERQAKVARALGPCDYRGSAIVLRSSGGRQQRGEPWRGPSSSAPTCCSDEPCVARRRPAEEMRVELKTIQRELRITTIFVTHDQAEALAMSDRIVVMHEGRKEQDGTPQDVYARPRSRFVAGFLGHSNFLDGRLEDGDGSFAWLQVDQGPRVQVPAPAGRVGGRALAVLRAERIVLGDAPTGPGVTRLVARVTAVDYQGTTVRYFLDVDGFRLQVIDTIDGPPLAEGTSVTVTIRGSDCVLPRTPMPPSAYRGPDTARRLAHIRLSDRRGPGGWREHLWRPALADPATLADVACLAEDLGYHRSRG